MPEWQSFQFKWLKIYTLNDTIEIYIRNHEAVLFLFQNQECFFDFLDCQIIPVTLSTADNGDVLTKQFRVELKSMFQTQMIQIW